MIHLRRAAAVDAARLWEVVTDWPGHGRYVPLTTVSTQGPEGAGRHLVARTRLGPLTLDDHMVITRWSPPGEPGGDGAGVVELTKDGRVLVGTVRIEVRPLGPARSELVWTEEIRLRAPGPGRLTAPAADLGARVLFGRLADRLVARAEHR